MKKNKIAALVVCAVTSISLVWMLYFLSEKVNHSPNGFVRLFLPHAISDTRSMDIKYNSYYIAGTSGGNIYLGNTTAPLLLFKTDTLLTDSIVRLISLDMTILRKLRSFTIEVDTTAFYLKDGLAPAILKGDLKTLHAVSYTYDSAFFTACAILGSHSFALRVSKNGKQEYLLAKEQNNLPNFRFVPGILQSQADGFFSTDGMFIYNSAAASLFYLYYYRNEFICMDSNLTVRYRGKTIDTTSWAKVKVSAINENKTIVLAAPPLRVNSRGCTSRNNLFVHSKLLSNNEDRQSFEKASVIDAYDIRTGRYKFSFYLYDHAMKKVKDFIVTGNTLVAIQDHYLVAYALNPSVFK